MSDEFNKKVIDLFSKNKKIKFCQHGEVCKCNEGYSYITIDTDENGRPLEEQALLKKADDFYYIVKFLVKNNNKTCINNFKIPGNDLLEFIKQHSDGNIDGQIIEIDKFYPDEWA